MSCLDAFRLRQFILILCDGLVTVTAARLTRFFETGSPLFGFLLSYCHCHHLLSGHQYHLRSLYCHGRTSYSKDKDKGKHTEGQSKSRESQT